MLDMNKLSEKLPEGVSADAVLSAIRDCGYSVVPSEGYGDEEPEAAGVEIIVGAMGSEDEGSEDEGSEGRSKSFPKGSYGDKLAKVKKFLSLGDE